MSTTMCFGVEYVLVNCGADGCDQSFGMARGFYDETMRTGRGWTCPKGHNRVWRGKTTEQKLAAAEARETALRDQLEAAARENEATKAALLRDRARFANGVCPCCNRSFQNVARHMSTQHPDYDVTKVRGVSDLDYACSCGRSFHTLGGLHQHQTKQRRPGWFKPTAGKWAAHLTVVPS